MSGGPPHHPHSRQAPIGNTAWNHLQVPNFYANRPPQHAHMSNEHPLLHQPTWHTPTTNEPMKAALSHSHLFNLEQMITERQYSRPSPGVDLTLTTRNGSGGGQNGDVPTTPISLSVRDTNKINSLPPSALDIQAVELTKSVSPSLKTMSSPGLKTSHSPGLMSASPGLKSSSPGLKSPSPGLKSASPGLKLEIPNLKIAVHAPSLLKSTSPGLKMPSPGLSSGLLNMDNNKHNAKNAKRSNKRVDSILERLNPMVDKSVTDISEQIDSNKSSLLPMPQLQSVIVQPGGGGGGGSLHDENSNSSSILNVPTPTNVREDDVVSPYSNEDSLDSNKSRRKRKPSKTVRVSKEDEKVPEDAEITMPSLSQVANSDETRDKQTDKSIKLPRVDDKDVENVDGKGDGHVSDDQSKTSKEPEHFDDRTSPKRTRRKSSSEAETIDNIAAMINDQKSTETEKPDLADCSKSINSTVVSADDTPKPMEAGERAHSTTTPTTTMLVTPAQRKATNFVEVENKLEAMFAGIENDPRESISATDNVKATDSMLDNDVDNKSNFNTIPSTSQQSSSNDNVTSTSNDILMPAKNQKNSSSKSNKQKRKNQQQQKNASENCYGIPNKKKKKKINKKMMSKVTALNASKKISIGGKPLNGRHVGLKTTSAADATRDVYAYDSGSNASSTRSRGPFVQIKGPRESPIAVNIINAPANDDDAEKKPSKPKKFHDDSEYRHKVKSKGLHSSTLSNKYDARTRDVSWMCAFCKRGPHATEPNTTGPSSYHASVLPPGDLFGPYTITTRSAEFERRIDDPYDKQFVSKKQLRTVDIITSNGTGSVASCSSLKAVGKKAKRKYSEQGDRVDENDVYLGITETGDDGRTYEIWAHEDCVVWSPSVYLIGHKIVGLEEAVWTSCNVNCTRCNFKGANVCCLKRGCTGVMHFGCAKTAGWQLDDGDFKAFCQLHRTRYV